MPSIRLIKEANPPGVAPLTTHLIPVIHPNAEVSVTLKGHCRKPVGKANSDRPFISVLRHSFLCHYSGPVLCYSWGNLPLFVFSPQASRLPVPAAA